jgi:RNA polymerase sigma-54 factor
LETNPLLEVEEDFEFDENRKLRNDEDSQELGQAENDHIPEDLPVDTQWEDTFDHQPVTNLSAGPVVDAGLERENQDESTDTLQEHLMWQMRLTPFTPTEQAIATLIIDSIEEDGYLKATVESIHESLVTDLEELDVEEVETVLHRIQHFDPVGVAARDLRECLLIQLRVLEASGMEQSALLKELIDQHLDTLAKRDYAAIRRALKVTDEELTDLVKAIQLLNPRPGSQLQTDKTEYIVPDVYARKVNQRWQLSLNPDNAPRLQIAEHYAQLINRADSSAENTYLKNNLQEARWFLKSLQSRNETLLKVTEAIVARQQDFLDFGEEAMKPLVLADIAEEVEMHESTISRVTTRKYLHTPRGIFELKYFFSSHVSTDSGGECSATAIRAIIKKLVAAENPRKPLSDSKIAAILGDQGINVARRTIAKYRETLAIPPSNERKRLV